MTALTTAELAIYAVFAVPTLLNLFKHGWNGTLGWLYLSILCALKIVGGALALSGNHTAIIITNVGLSPLLLGAVGILSEARHYRLPSLDQKLNLIFVLIYHILATSGVAILATGASGLVSTDPSPSDPALAKAGIAILTLAWALLCLWSGWTLVTTRHETPSPAAQRTGQVLLVGVLVADVFIGAAVLYTLAAIADGSLLSGRGSLALEVVFSVVPQMLAVVVLNVAGLLTWERPGKEEEQYANAAEFGLSQAGTWEA